MAVIAAGLVLLLLSLIASPFLTFRIPALSGFTLFFSIVGVGCQLRAINQDTPVFARHVAGRQSSFIVQIETPPQRRPHGMSCLVSVRWELKSGRCYFEHERLQVYFSDTIILKGWEAGSLRVIRI